MKLKIVITFLFCFLLLLNMDNNVLAQELNVSAKSACLIVSDSGDIIFAKNQNEELPMASTTKIMTALIVLETLEACGNKEVELTDEMVRIEGTSMGLMPKDVVNLDALAKGMLLCSGNDAATASAFAIGGSIENFVKMMNEKAEQIGMHNTCFVTPSGLDSGNHHSTAYDMAILGAYAMENNNFVSIASKKSDRVEFISPPKSVSIRNHNKLLRLYDGCIGVKTGFTKAAGRCLVSCAQRNNVKLIAVTLNAPNDWEDHRNMLDYGFANTVNVSFNDRQTKVKVPVYGGTVNEVNACGVSAFSHSFKKGDETKVKRVVEAQEHCNAPIEKGQIVGRVAYYLDGKEIGKNEILAETQVEKIKEKRNFFQKIIEFIKKSFKF